MSNVIQYTSRTFNSILADINSDAELRDKPGWFKKIWAGVGDVISMWMNAEANNHYLPTAFTRQAVADLCRLIDYDLSPPVTSSGDLLFYLDADTVSFPISYTADKLKAVSSGSLAVSSKRFEARTGYSQPAQTMENATHSSGEWTVARDYITGEKVRISTTGTLPSPLDPGADYYVIRVNATTIRLAVSVADAFAGNHISSSGGTGTHQIRLWSFMATVYQQESAAAVVLGTSDGISPWQRFDFSDKNIILDTVKIIINSVLWSRVDSFINSSPSDPHYKILYKTDGGFSVMFGSGIYGMIPGAFAVNSEYAIGGGLESNVNVLNSVSAYASDAVGIVGVSNPRAITGGADAETIENAKVVAPMLLKTRDRFVTAEDGRALALGFGGITRCRVNPNVYGLLSSQVVIVPTGGGTSSAGFKSDLDDYLTERTILEQIDVRVIDASYNTINFVGTAKLKSGYTWSAVHPFIILALRLIVTEIGYEIYSMYKSEGISEAVEIINSKWSTSFGGNDFEQIQRLLDNFNPAEIGFNVQRSDAEGFVDSFVYGVDYINISSPSFPISNSNIEITTDGSVTITQV